MLLDKISFVLVPHDSVGSSAGCVHVELVHLGNYFVQMAGGGFKTMLVSKNNEQHKLPAFTRPAFFCRKVETVEMFKLDFFPPPILVDEQ